MVVTSEALAQLVDVHCRTMRPTYTLVFGDMNSNDGR